MNANRQELAAVFGVSLPTVDAYVREGMPFLAKPGDGGRGWQFRVPDCVNWRIKKAENGLKKVDERAQIDLRIASAEATIKEIKVAEMQKTLIHIDDVVQVFEQQLAVVKSRLNALPPRLDQTLALVNDPKDVRRLLLAEIDEILTEISAFYLLAEKTSVPFGVTVEPNIPDVVPELGGPVGPVGLDTDGY